MLGVAMTFGDLLKKLRVEAGMTQTELAEKSGMPLGSLRGQEQGQRNPSWPAVVKLARALGVATDVFSECDEVAAEEPEPETPIKPKGK